MPNSATPIRIEPSTNFVPPSAPLTTFLCADGGCDKRRQLSPKEIADLILGENELSEAIDTKIGNAIRSYTGDRFTAQGLRMDSLDEKVGANTIEIKRIADSTAGIVELMQSWTGAMKTIDATGKVLKPLTWIIGFFTALAGLWAALRGGK
jgi:hypothetical protein